MKIYEMIKGLYENENKQFKVVGDDNNKIFKAQYFEGYKGAIMIDMGDGEVEMLAINETTMKQEYEEVKEPVNFFEWEEGKEYKTNDSITTYKKKDNTIWRRTSGTTMYVKCVSAVINFFTESEWYEV